MSIRKWHHGKLIVLWSWGAFIAAIALTDVKTAKADQLTFFRLFELLFILVMLVALSIVTWIWLGGKEDSIESLTMDERQPAADEQKAKRALARNSE